MQNKITNSSLIEFSVENFGCFRDKVTFSMETRKDAKNSFSVEDTGDTLLKTGVIYGPNASGKSTLIKAMQFMKTKIMVSSNNNGLALSSFSQFTLEDIANKLTSFEITFSINNSVYRYEFSINQNNIVEKESLIQIKGVKEENLFIRKKNIYSSCSSAFNDKLVQEKTKDTYLFLTTCNQWTDSIAVQIFQFFETNINFIDSHNTSSLLGFTAEKSKKDPEFKNKVLKFMQQWDFSFIDFEEKEKEVSISSLPKGLQEMLEKNGNIPSHGKVKEVSLQFLHKTYNSKNKEIGVIEISRRDMSGGTNKIFDEIGPIIDSLKNGFIIVIDELNTSLHPKILKAIVDLFQSEETNPNNAQLIFTSHETSLLAHTDEIDRDAFWFTERDQYGRASLFSLAEFKERKDKANIDKRYLNGAYGAVPFIAYDI